MQSHHSPQDKNLSLDQLHVLIDQNARLLLNNGVIARGLLMVVYCPLCKKPGAEISLRSGAWWHRCNKSDPEPTYGYLFADPAHVIDGLEDFGNAAKEGREKMLAHIAELRVARSARKKAKKEAEKTDG